MVERSLRARTRALHVREHGWWRATHVAEYEWTRAHEEASRNVDSATERITDMKEKIYPIIEERDTLKQEYCLIKERLAEHAKGADTLRELLQKSVEMLHVRAEKLEKGRSHVQEMEDETRVLEERNNKELATIQAEIDMLSKKSSDLEKEWLESHETTQKQNEDKLCELQSVNMECVETCHELVKMDSENSRIRCNIQKNKDRSHKCRPDLARDIKMLQQLQQELEEILTDSQNQGDKHENRNQTKMLPRQCDGSIDLSIFLECLTRTLESSLNKSIVDKGDTIPCDLLKSVVDNEGITEDSTVFLKTFLKCLLAKDLYGSVEKCLEENGVENNANTKGNNKPNNLSSEECSSGNQTKYNDTNKYTTTNQPNDQTVMQINNKFCIANKCPAENLTQDGEKCSTCCLNMDTIYVIPIKECDKDGNSKQEKFESSEKFEPITKEQRIKDLKTGKISSTEIPLGCIEYEVTCSNCGVDRCICNRNSDAETKNNRSLGDNNASARLLNEILELKCNTKIGEPCNRTEKSPGVQNVQSAEPNIKQLYILPTCSENFENLGTLTPISSIDVSPIHIAQQLSTCPYCLQQSRPKESSGDIREDTNYATDFINMVVLHQTCKKKECRKNISEFLSKKSTKVNSISKRLIAECLQSEPCFQCPVLASSENISECNDVNKDINTVDMNTQYEKCLPEKSDKISLERCLEKLLHEINLPKFLDDLLIAIGQGNKVSCCDIEMNTSLNNSDDKTNLCHCDAKECLCELKLSKLDVCQCRVNESKISLKVSSNIRETKQIVSKPSNVSCLCDKPLDSCMCKYGSVEIDDCKCQETVKPSSKILNNLQAQDVSCLCDKPLDVCMCKYESSEIDDCKCQEIETKLSFKLSTNACSPNITENMEIAPVQSSNMTCLCKKPLDQCTCHENTLHPELANLNGNITAKTLSNLCVCDKCQSIHLNLLKKLAKCASDSQDNVCFADEILNEIDSFPKICNDWDNRPKDCGCDANAFDADKVDKIIGTPRTIRSMTTNTCVNENIETCTSYGLPMKGQICESNLKQLPSNMTELHSAPAFATPQNSASKLVLHSKISDLGLDTVPRVKSSNSVTFVSSENVENLENLEKLDTEMIPCECFEDKHRRDVKASINICNSKQNIKAFGTSEKLTSTSKETCQYSEKSNQESSNTSNTCYSDNLTNDELIKVILKGTNLKPDDLRKVLNERLRCLQNCLEFIDETEIKEKTCIPVKPSNEKQCIGEVRNTIDKQCSPYKKDATNSISEMRFPSQNNSLPFPIEIPSCEILSNEHISSKNSCGAQKKQCLNKLSSPEQPQNIRNKPVSPKKRPSLKFPCSETPTLKNMSTYPKQRSPKIFYGNQNQTLINKPTTLRKYLPNKCPAFDTKAKCAKINSIDKSELPGLKQQNSKSNLSCGCIEETINFTDYTQGDKISIGCSARNSQLKCVPTKRNTINSQVPSNIYPSTPYSSIATCYNDIDEIPTLLSNNNTNIDTNRSKTCHNKYKTSTNNDMMPPLVNSPESYCSRSTSCSILRTHDTDNNLNRNNLCTAVKKDLVHTITCECSKDAKSKPTPTYCEKSDVMTDTDKLENISKPNFSAHENIELSTNVLCHCKYRDKPNQRDEQNEIKESKCSKSTCISFTQINSEINNSFANNDNAHTVSCECVKDAICKCEGRREVAQKTNKITCQDGTNTSNETSRKRKKSMYSQSEGTSCEKFDEFTKSKDQVNPKGETCICDNRQKSSSTCVALSTSNLLSNSSFVYDRNTANVGQMTRFCGTNELDDSKHRSNSQTVKNYHELCLCKERENSSINQRDVERAEKIKCTCVSHLPPNNINDKVTLSTNSITQNNLSERNLVLFCSVESKTCAAKSNVENITDVQTESKIWKQRYVALKPKTKSNSSCNRNTCLPLLNKENKILVQVPNTGSSLPSNESAETPKIYDEIVEKQCNMCEPEEKSDETSKSSDDTSDMQKENDETNQTQIENVETSQNQIENDETSQTQLEKDVENEINTIQAKNDDICYIKQKYGKLCRSAVKKYEIISKTQLENHCPLSCSWARKKNKFKCKKSEKYSEACATREKNNMKCKTQGKQNDKFYDLEKCLEECLGKRKDKCNCRL